MLQGEHFAIILTCIKRLSVLKTKFGLLFEWPLKTGLTVLKIFFFLQYFPYQTYDLCANRKRFRDTFSFMPSTYVFIDYYLDNSIGGPIL